MMLLLYAMVILELSAARELSIGIPIERRIEKRNAQRIRHQRAGSQDEQAIDKPAPQMRPDRHG